MSKADKMLKEVGYGVWQKGSCVVLTRNTGTTYDEITIDTMYNEISFELSGSMIENEIKGLFLKVKELGWLE